MWPFGNTKGPSLNRSEKEMSAWLAHPMEYGKPPLEIKEIHREKTAWPFTDGKVEVVFHEFKMDEQRSNIGMTGPITWSFRTDLHGFSMEEIKKIYAGWYVSFMTTQAENFSKEQHELEWKNMDEYLKERIPGFISIKEFLHVESADLLFYTYVKEEGGKKQFVSMYDDDEPIEFVQEEDSKYLKLPSLYYFIGNLFFSDKFN
jgi:hypothetical protein